MAVAITPSVVSAIISVVASGAKVSVTSGDRVLADTVATVVLTVTYAVTGGAIRVGVNDGIIVTRPCVAVGVGDICIVGLAERTIGDTIVCVGEGVMVEVAVMGVIIVIVGVAVAVEFSVLVAVVVEDGLIVAVMVWVSVDDGAIVWVGAAACVVGVAVTSCADKPLRPPANMPDKMTKSNKKAPKRMS